MNASGSAPQKSFDEICGWLVSTIARELKVQEQQIRIDEKFANLGLGSRQAIQLTGRLEDFLACEELDPSLLWDFPTIESLARHLAKA